MACPTRQPPERPGHGGYHSWCFIASGGAPLPLAKGMIGSKISIMNADAETAPEVAV